jgi:transcriptional regulator with XRE-family HTH domain
VGREHVKIGRGTKRVKSQISINVARLLNNARITGKRHGDGKSCEAISERMNNARSPQQLRDYLSAKYPIPIEILLKLCDALDVSIDKVMDVALKSYGEIKDEELDKDYPYSDIENYRTYYSDKEDKLVWGKLDELEKDPEYKRQRKPHVKQILKKSKRYDKTML